MTAAANTHRTRTVLVYALATTVYLATAATVLGFALTH